MTTQLNLHIKFHSQMDVESTFTVANKNNFDKFNLTSSHGYFYDQSMNDIYEVRIELLSRQARLRQQMNFNVKGERHTCTLKQLTRFEFKRDYNIENYYTCNVRMTRASVLNIFNGNLVFRDVTGIQGLGLIVSYKSEVCSARAYGSPILPPIPMPQNKHLVNIARIILKHFRDSEAMMTNGMCKSCKKCPDQIDELIKIQKKLTDCNYDFNKYKTQCVSQFDRTKRSFDSANNKMIFDRMKYMSINKWLVENNLELRRLIDNANTAAEKYKTQADAATHNYHREVALFHARYKAKCAKQPCIVSNCSQPKIMIPYKYTAPHAYACFDGPLMSCNVNDGFITVCPSGKFVDDHVSDRVSEYVPMQFKYSSMLNSGKLDRSYLASETNYTVREHFTFTANENDLITAVRFFPTTYTKISKVLLTYMDTKTRKEYVFSADLDRTLNKTHGATFRAGPNNGSYDDTISFMEAPRYIVTKVLCNINTGYKPSYPRFTFQILRKLQQSAFFISLPTRALDDFKQHLLFSTKSYKLQAPYLSMQHTVVTRIKVKDHDIMLFLVKAVLGGSCVNINTFEHYYMDESVEKPCVPENAPYYYVHTVEPAMPL